MARGIGAESIMKSFPLAAPLYTFSDFQTRAVKTKALSVQDSFMQHLMQIKGVTAAKAAAIVEVYPTPRSLMDALDAQPDEAARDSLLKSLKYQTANSTRSIGIATSQILAHLYSDQRLL